MVDGDSVPTRSPWLADLVAAVSAPSQLWCGADGEVDGSRGAEGFWHGDVRALRSAVLTPDGERCEPLLTAPDGASGIVSVGVARHREEVRVDRRRRLAAGALRESIVLTSVKPLRCTVVLTLTSDLASMDAVKGGRPVGLVAPADWVGGGVQVAVTAPDATVDVVDEQLRLVWTVDLVPGVPHPLGWSAAASDAGAVVVAPPGPAGWDVRVECTDVRLVRWVERALADLDALRMAPLDQPDEVFVAAGAPWYLTLFGRDTLWSARMLLPLGTDLAASTLRVLAARQGRRDDPGTGEEPGKILHEVRRGSAVHGGTTLPPLYYGTVDATSLWICLLHETWRAGMSDPDVEELLPNLEAALAWQESRGDEFLAYVGEVGHGLQNQGWKDGDDSVQWQDGRFAAAPIALCEVQGYAHQAALAGADLLEHFGRNAAGQREWAGRLRTRFRSRFWVGRAAGLRPESFPAIALDREGQAVDSLTSNIGHLLGTGLLDGAESAVVARHLAADPLAGGFGLRTLATTAAGFSSLSYHGGAVWAHDTAIAITGLVRAGFPAEAKVLVDGLLVAAEAFEHRMPELHSGDARADVPVPVPYPSSCRPQAWSAAAAVAVLGACLADSSGVLPRATLSRR